MRKLLLLSALLIFACSTDSEGNPCIYEPTLSTEAATDITETSATLNGVISIVSENCDVALGEMQGFVYSTNPSPSNDDSVEIIYGTEISTTIDNLIPDTTYYVRVFITNSLGEFYGNEVEFSTNEEIIGLVNCDGNPVPTIVYGTQEWTVENACHITYRDGTPIPEITDSTEWSYLTTGAWAYYNNDPTKPKLYNWYAVMGIHDTDPNTPNKEFAPEDWHVPSDTEWTTLEEHLSANGFNFDDAAGNRIAKAMASISGWNSSTYTGVIGNDQSLNNNSGFNAFPEGIRTGNGAFANMNSYANFWSLSGTLEPVEGAWYRFLSYDGIGLAANIINNVAQGHPPQSGCSVRFVRD